MSYDEALTARLADLEADSFQLKLRNYYLERRVATELAGARGPGRVTKRRGAFSRRFAPASKRS